jgi:hypothetical protein
MDYGRNEGIFKELKAEPELDRVLKYRPISWQNAKRPAPHNIRKLQTTWTEEPEATFKVDSHLSVTCQFRNSTVRSVSDIETSSDVF